VKPERKHAGVVVPMVTPLTSAGRLDEGAVERLVEILVAGEVDGIFVLGTTGEGAMVSRPDRQRLVRQVVALANSRVRVYAGIGDSAGEDALLGNDYLAAGVDAVVARAPVSMESADLQSWFQSVLDQLNGPMILYNIPMLNQVSIPLEVVDQLRVHPGVIGIKESENNLERLSTLIRRFGRRPGFSIFVGVGKLMEEGLRLGAHGIVPSVGNLIPETCHHFWECAQRGDWAAVKRHAGRMNAVAAIYQANRDLGESLSALKGALSLCNICERHMFPPLHSLDAMELQALAGELERLDLMADPKPGHPPASAIQPSLH
jgi:4-hydroxy-tetrahydrodipicolinate synthase